MAAGKASLNGASGVTIADLEDRFRRITQLLYDTRVSLPVLEREVMPHLAPGIEFVDPWVHVRGLPTYGIGLRGFHCVIRFDLDIFQVAVELDERSGSGRAMVDGVMNLRQLGFYTYPLRTILVYEFLLTGGPEVFRISRHEEMWSFGDMLRNLPFAGVLYEAFRRASGVVFTGLFRLGCAVFGPKARAAPVNFDLN